MSGPIPGQSVLGLVGEGDIVYGTTGIKGGYGAADDTKPAHVFAWNVAQGRLVWKRALTGEVEINSPILVRGVLYVSTNNGVIRLNKGSGSVVAVYRLLDRSAPAAYKTSTIAYLPKANGIAHLCGGTVTLLNTYRNTRKEILRGVYTDMVVNKQSRLFFAENGTSVVEVDAVQKPTIRSAADLVSVGPNGWLYVCRSSRDGRFGDPIRADSGFGGYVRSAHVVDWNGDGIQDVLTNRTDGTLRLHRGLPEGGFLPPTILASSGWGAVDLDGWNVGHDPIGYSRGCQWTPQSLAHPEFRCIGLTYNYWFRVEGAEDGADGAVAVQCSCPDCQPGRFLVQVFQDGRREGVHQPGTAQHRRILRDDCIHTRLRAPAGFQRDCLAGFCRKCEVHGRGTKFVGKNVNYAFLLKSHKLAST